MCREMDKIYNEGAEQGRAEGWAKGKAEGQTEGEIKKARETAYELADKEGFSAERIANVIKVNLSTVKKWLEERPVMA